MNEISIEHVAWLHVGKEDQTSITSTHLIVETTDTFEAIIPWNELIQAAVLYQIDDLPLSKAGPIRLYVPNGSS